MMGQGGMLGGATSLDEDGHGLMHDTMVSVFAEKLGLTVDELNNSRGEFFDGVVFNKPALQPKNVLSHRNCYKGEWSQNPTRTQT